MSNLIPSLAAAVLLLPFDGLLCGDERTCNPEQGSTASGSGDSGSEALTQALFTSCGEVCAPCAGSGCQPQVDNFSPGSNPPTQTKYGGTPGGQRTVDVTFGAGVSITVSCTSCS